MATATLIKNLQNPELYAHDSNGFKVIETHISWVILTGEYCYKIKKPMDFGFLDFSSLEKRQHYCEKELQLNQALAPEIYLEVLAITGSEEKPEINGDGDIIEYAIKMREFSQSNLFDNLLQKEQLHSIHMIDLAHELANFHEKTDKDSPEFFGTPSQILEPVQQNFQQIREIIKDSNDLNELRTLENWSLSEHNRLEPIFKERKQQGFIRACHGDVHLGNITLFNDKPVIFDCIEFNESFRWTDTMADLGFLLMDLYEKQQPKFAAILLNTYMIHTGDYQGLQVLRYYQVYRAVVRAKISLFEYTQQTDTQEANKRYEQYQKFIRLALSFIKSSKAKLIITHGYSCSGKSTLAKLLVERMGLIQLRSDVERKRMHGIAVNANSYSGIYSDLYSEEATANTYQRLFELMQICLQSSYDTIIDATFQEEKYRRTFREYALSQQHPFCIIYCNASLETLMEWITMRSPAKQTSEADKAVLLAQQEKFDELTSEEIACCLSVNTENPINVESIEDFLKNLDD